MSTSTHEQYRRIADRVEQRYSYGQALDQQLHCLMEEVGEGVAAYRRYRGRSRHSAVDSYQDMARELADVIITTNVFARLLAIDLSDEVTKKLQVIEERGGW